MLTSLHPDIWRATHSGYVRWAAKERLSPQASEEVVSDAELELLRRLAVRPPQRVSDFDRERYWAFRTALRDYVRNRSRGPLPLDDTVTDRKGDPAVLLLNRDLRKNLSDVVKELPPLLGQVLFLYYLEGRTDAQIGEIIGRSRYGARDVRRRAIFALQTRITYSTRRLLLEEYYDS